ncbi:uncharacterized protein KRP23_1553 [Phytophthora ramorum]|uniref:uncharacterized protein n=1 Tax=Phytophthora ramorum TaxID=164328 RepID=UPI003099CC03|nr:hypothetical protein KRP23_1553 [Phytophthora ramorum]
MNGDSARAVSSKAKPKASSGRRGLFDDSSSDEDDDSDTGLFGVGGKRASDSDSDNETSFFAQPRKAEATSPKSATTHNAVAGGAGPSVVVLFTTSALRNEGKKSVGVFTFTLQFGNLEHSFSFTYSEFEEIHTRLTSAFPGTVLPKFPSKHRLRNNTKPENMQKRAQEFRLYLQQLVALPGVLSSDRFQFEYHIDGAFARALANSQQSNGSATNGAQSNGRPPKPSCPLPRKEQGAQLKKAGDAEDGDAASKPPPPPALTQPGSINEAITNAMALRRIHVEYEEANSGADSDSDDDWD